MCGKQCRNIEVDGKQTSISKDVEDSIFESLCSIDVELLAREGSDKRIAETMHTYLPFDSHYLLVKIGADNLEFLTDLRLTLTKARERFGSGKDDEKTLRSTENNVEELLQMVENNIINEGE